MQTYLVPLDFSPHSRNAARYAIALARETGARVLLLHAFDDPLGDADLPAYGEEGSSLKAPITEAALRQAVGESGHDPDGPVKVETRLMRGEILRQILAGAKAEGADLIIMGHSGSSPLQKILFGSITARVMAHAPCPVLAIPEGYVYQPLKELLYASNFDQADGPVLQQLGGLFGDFSYRLHVAYIFDDSGLPLKAADFEPLKEQLLDHVAVSLPEVPVEILVCGDKDLVQGLKNQLSEHQGDLLIMTTHVRNFFSRLLNPSATQRMLFHTPVPLLAFPAVEA